MPFEIVVPTAGQVRAYQKENDCGIAAAYKALRAIAFSESLRELRSKGTLEDKVEWLLDRYAEKIFIS